MTSSMTAAPRMVAPSRDAQRAELDQRLRGDADAGRGQDGADEDSFPVQRQPESDGGGNASGHRQHDAAEGSPERHLADAAHLGEVGFEPRDEHEQDDADLGEIADDGEKVRRRWTAPGAAWQIAASRARSAPSARGSGRRGSHRRPPAARSCSPARRQAWPRQRPAPESAAAAGMGQRLRLALSRPDPIALQHRASRTRGRRQFHRCAPRRQWP